MQSFTILVAFSIAVILLVITFIINITAKAAAKKLKKALTESIDSASEEDKTIMKDALNNLNIDLEEEKTEKTLSEDAELSQDVEDYIIINGEKVPSNQINFQPFSYKP